MRTLDTGKLYIKELFKETRFFRIPEYQRPYVWEATQVNDLLNDIDAAQTADIDKEYFLGCMIWNISRLRDGEYEFDCLDILDGQQRLITLYLLHAVLRDLTENPKLKQKVDERLAQPEDKFDGVPARNRVQFTVRNDKKFLEAFVLANGGTLRTEELDLFERDDSEGVSAKTMARAIRTMHQWWTERLAESDSPQNVLDRAFSFLSNKVLVLYLATPDNLDDAYNLFTVLNSRGVQLSAGDILRAQHLREIEDESSRLDLSRRWDECIDRVHSPVDTFDEFLKYVALAQIRFTSDKTKNLKAAFDYLIDKGDLEPGRGFFNLVERYSKHLAAFSSPAVMQMTEEESTDFENLYFILSETFGAQFVMPLMHYRERFGDHRILDFMIKLDNLASMLWLLGRRTLQQRMFLLIRAMDEAATASGSKEARADTFMKDERLNFGYKHGRSNTDVTIEELRTLLDEEHWGSFGGVRVNKPRYLLLKLDLLHGTPLTRLAFNRAVSTVEHLMPRSPSFEVKADDDFDDWVHRLGNLALLDRKKNSSLGNCDFPEKRKRYKGTYETRPYTNHIFMSYDKWSAVELRSQHLHVVDKLVDYYAHNCVEGLKKARTRKAL